MFNVMIVDDEWMIKKSLRKIIEESGIGFTVAEEANNGCEAMDKIRDNAPDLLIVDIKMPEMDGLELLERLKESGFDIVSVIISGYDDFVYVQHAMRFGAADYILKPIVPEQVSAMLSGMHARLKAQDDTLVESNEWVWFCKNNGQELAERIWLLDERSVQEILRRIDEFMLNERISLRSRRQLYMNLAALVAGELGRKGESVAEPGGFAADPRLFAREKDLPLAARQVFSTMMNVIRRHRNFAFRKHVELAVAYIERHYERSELSLSEVAGHVKLSPPRLSLLFREETGESFIRHLTAKRMEKAQQLLRDPASKASDVSLLVGYNDYSHFNKAFKKYCGCSPIQFKKNLGAY